MICEQAFAIIYLISVLSALELSDSIDYRFLFISTLDLLKLVIDEWTVLINIDSVISLLV